MTRATTPSKRQTKPAAAVAISPTPGADTVVADLRAVYATRRTRPLAWRLAQLDGLDRLLAEQEPAIAEAMAADLGRNAYDTWFGEIVGTKAEIDIARKNLKRWVRPQRRSLPLIQLPGSARVEFEPLGTVLIIGPWNYPVFLTLSPLVGAVAAGNTVVIKPSELAPKTSELLARILPQYVDGEAIRVVEGDGAGTQALLAQGFDHALFTGGTEIGKKIMEGAAKTLTPVTLELGGKSPVVILSDADLEVAARRILWVKLLNSGQTCIAPDYILVENSVKPAFIDALRKVLAELRAGEPDAQRIVNQRQFARLAGYLESTSGSVVTGGCTDAASISIEPTIIDEPAPTDAVMTEEIFGPILPVLGVANAEAAVAFVNSRPKPLAFYVFTRSRATADRLIRDVPSGGAVVNHVAMHCLVPSLPFGGVGASGMGTYHGRWGFETFSHRKAVLTKTQKPDLRLQYPPYSEFAKKLLRRVL
ncbi:aldehyde dehydrogenase family protein [Gordonia pseudamarae]|jgi:aldehyde dehydrogenase (NAD+)|uniref:Aldehyde dehydrogenase n=1 Tax=Gordonia pseudamarae TaxID=2831662 RepID=A0ABX6IKW4_9ACTN|nr:MULTISPECIES: aldehyde dehydrogenase family protein [Gordonia]MBD0023239.1 aldehyde dehydrogenase family protein [Gordonia sp. (in: high G+C Gram-positive bacteria)]QHN27056.1 aldehyde dehydrogenase family protein [Gordonia pseudamarae]QHN35945.1 aldehyde dehydrogenase family protein [Gordonia pseudamarae]